MPWRGDQLIPHGCESPVMCEMCGSTHFEFSEVQRKYFLVGAWYYEHRVEYEMKCKKCGHVQTDWDTVYDMSSGVV